MKLIGYGRQSVDESDISAVVNVLRSDYLTQGPIIERFERALADRVGAKHAVAVANGTAALHLACIAAGAGPGSVGVTSAVTFVASANCLRYCGAEARIVDIEPEGLGMSPAGLAQFLKRKPETSIIIPVDMGGLASLNSEVRSLASNRTVIEDACHALGGTYESGTSVGSGEFAEMTVFSFHPVKAITTGEGGAVVTNDAPLANHLRRLRSHGIERQRSGFTNLQAQAEWGGSWYYEQQELGLNYRLNELQAALGLSQLMKLDRFIHRRKEIAAAYDAAFEAIPNMLRPQSTPKERARSGLHLYLVQMDRGWGEQGRVGFMGELAKRGVGSQVHYIPVYRQPYHQQRLQSDWSEFPHAEKYYSECLSLPIAPAMTDEDVQQVVTAVRDCCELISSRLS